MPLKQCTICADPGRKAEVDSLLSQKVTLAEIATLTGVGKWTIFRHSKHGGEQNHESKSKRAWLRILSRAQKAGDVKEMRVAQRELDKLDARNYVEHKKPGGQHQPSPDWIKGVREALGFVDQPGQSRHYRNIDGRLVEVANPADQRLLDELKAAGERHSNPKVLASIARLMSLLLGVGLPPELEAAARALEGHGEELEKLDS